MMFRSLFIPLLCLFSQSLAVGKETPRQNSIKHTGPKLSRYEQPNGVPSHPMHFLEHGVDVRFPVGARDYHKEGAEKQAGIEKELLESKLQRVERSSEGKGLVRKKRFLDKTISWENGIIPYIFSGISTSAQAFVLSAMATVEQYTCVRFFVRGSGGYSVPHNVYLRFINGNGCYSYLGRTSRVPQDISPCNDYFTALHEIIHALGGYHEQSHYDRDQNIHLKLNNVLSGREGNFRSVSDIFRNDFIIYPFDGQSTMHYSDFGFSKNGLPTIDPYYDDVSLFRDSFWYSMKEVNEAYQCTQQCTSGIPTCVNDGYPGYYEDSCQCICPEGLNPATNCATFLPGFTGELIDLTTSTRTAAFGTPNAPSSTIPAGSKYMWIVRAPAGSKLYVSITDMVVSGSTTSCVSLLTVKRNLLGQNGTDYCGQGFSKPITSVDNVIALILDARSSSNSYLQATATLLPADEGCYNPADKGVTYNGERNIAEDNTPCLYWANTTQCDYVPFSMSPLQADYSGNECRNPGGVLPGPWCYTDVNSGGCVIKLCNPCNYGGEYDSYDDCDALITADGNYCNTDDAAIGCRDTCNLDQTITSASSCGPPPDVNGGSLVGSPSASYAIGSSVNYQCDINSIVVPRFCLSTGQWSEMGSVCNGGPTTPTTTTTTPAPTTTTTTSTPSTTTTSTPTTTTTTSTPTTTTTTTTSTPTTTTTTTTSPPTTTTTSTPTTTTTTTTSTPTTTTTTSTPTTTTTTSTPTTTTTTSTPTTTTTTSTPTTTTTTSTPTTTTTTTTTAPSVACEAGYTGNVDDGFCYRYVGSGTRFGNARTQCQAENAEVTDARTEETQLFLVALRDSSGNSDNGVYLNMKFRRNGSFWFWRPRTADRVENFYTNWDTGTSAGPDGFTDRCGYIGPQSTGNKWFAARCNANHDIICKKDALTSTPSQNTLLTRHRRSLTICDDRRGDCEAVIDFIPNMCSAYSTYAQECPATCGSCNPSGVTCSVPTPQPGDNTVLQTDSAPRTPGQVIQYACTSGVLASGNLQRACKGDGTFTGSPPTCADESATTSYVTKGELRPLQFATPRIQFYGPSPLTTITRAGRVVQWRAYCREPGTIRMMVMRNVGTDVEILGTNDVDCRRNRIMEWDMPNNLRIPVQPGDFIGVADLAGGRLMYSYCDDFSNYGYLEYNFVANSALVSGARLAKDSNYFLCLVVPFNVVIGP